MSEKAHEKLLENLHSIGWIKKDKILKKHKTTEEEISFTDLIDGVHSSKNAEIVRREANNKKRSKVEKRNRTLCAPLHKKLTDRIEGDAGYSEIRQHFDEWAPIVRKNRLADQLTFPLESDKVFNDCADQKLQSFTPRTSLEQAIQLLSNSKNELSNDIVYTEAELEILRAMSIEEMEAKCAHLRKMRALAGYQQVRLKWQAKIKSKSYHRHAKRRKEKQLAKDIEKLFVEDPEAAKTKFDEIDRLRILERATLKHRNGNKRFRLVSRYAGRNAEAKKSLEEQIRIGRTLAEKHIMPESASTAGTSDVEENTDLTSNHKLLERAACLIEKNDSLNMTLKDPKLKDSLREMRREKKRLCLNEHPVTGVTCEDEKNVSSQKEISSQKPHQMFPEESVWGDGSFDTENCMMLKVSSICDVDIKQDSESSTETGDGMKVGAHDLQSCEIFKGKKSSRVKSLSKKKKEEVCAAVEDCSEDRNYHILKTDNAAKPYANNRVGSGWVIKGSESIAVKSRSDKRDGSGRMDEDVNISMDPRHFLHMETSQIPLLSAELVDGVEDFHAQQQAIIAEAFEDDDVIADFESEKAAVEEAEENRDLDLTLQGWGKWAGPNIKETKKGSRFMIKAKQQKRKDRGKNGIIITEAVDRSVEKMQPKEVPFPYTSVEEFETILQQPLGQEWNPHSVFKYMIRPTHHIQAGKIIKPMTKAVLLEAKANSMME